MNAFIIYQSKSRVGGDRNFFEEYKKSFEGQIVVHSLSDEFQYLQIIENLYNSFSVHGVGLLGFPLSCLLSEIKGLSTTIKKLKTQSSQIHLVGPRLVHASLVTKIASACMIDFLPLSYKRASVTRKYIYSTLYACEANRFMKLLKKLTDIELTFFSERDIRMAEKLVGGQYKLFQFGRRIFYQPKRYDKIKKIKFVFIGNFESKMNEQAFLKLSRFISETNYENISCEIVIAGKTSARFSNVAKVVEYDNLQEFIAINDYNYVGFCYMPASAGKQNKIYDYLSLQIPMILDKRSFMGINSSHLKPFIVKELSQHEIIKVMKNFDSAFEKPRAINF